MSSLLDFERSLRPLEHALDLLKKVRDETRRAQKEQEIQTTLQERLREIYGQLTPWQKVQVARHRDRPYTLDYVQRTFSDFVELHGDRSFGDDRALLGGPAVLQGRTVMLIGQQKGRDTRENVDRNFGMPHPEGYRKGERLMRQAERLGLPVVALVDTPGANAGLMDEERGQAEAIASSIATMLSLRVPTVAVVIGEGGSGGALAISAADRLLMLEHAIFTVASPEAAAAILWRDAGQAPEAAQNMRITAQELRALGLVDGIVPEPLGGAHRDHAAAAASLGEALAATLEELSRIPADERVERRYDKYRDIDFFDG